MKRKNMKVEDIFERLYRLDEDAELTFSDDVEFKCYIVGGGALMIMGYALRATHDIDVLETIPKSLQELFSKYNMNCDVKAYSDNFPLGYEDRANKVDIDTVKISFYTLSLEDLVISKLCTTRYEQDKTDIESERVVKSIDWEKLEKLANTMKSQMLSLTNYENFYYNYQNYVKRFKYEEINI